MDTKFFRTFSIAISLMLGSIALAPALSIACDINGIFDAGVNRGYTTEEEEAQLGKFEDLDDGYTVRISCADDPNRGVTCINALAEPGRCTNCFTWFKEGNRYRGDQNWEFNCDDGGGGEEDYSYYD